MKPDAVQADRNQSIRTAARDWRRAGWIDEAALRMSEELYPDDRVRAGPAFRVVFFILSLAAIMSLALTLYSQIDSVSAVGYWAAAAGIGCAFAADHLIHQKKRRQGGIESAFVAGAIFNIVLGTMLVASRSHLLPDPHLVLLFWFLLSTLSACSAWRWGYWIYAALSCFALFMAIVMLPGGRIAWIAVMMPAYFPLIRLSKSIDLAPSLRKCALSFLVLGLMGFYAAGNLYFHDLKFAEFFPGLRVWNADFFPRWLSAVLTAAFPLFSLVAGVKKRSRPFLYIGFISAVLSLGTLRMYFHLAPPWVVLSAAGIFLFAGAALLSRFLKTGTGKERGGFTGEPLFSDRSKSSAAENIANLTLLSPGPTRAADQGFFEGGGGKFGGGGASGEF
jgi:hypothetical protein